MADDTSPISANAVSGMIAASNANSRTPIPLLADSVTQRLLVDAGTITIGAIAGSRTSNTAVPGATNLGVLAGIATNAAPSYTEGFLVGLSTDLSGNLRTTTTIAANSSVNISQINGITPLMGNGVTGTGSQRVTIASDNTPFPIKIDQTTPGTTNAIALAQVGSTTTATGNGVVGAGVQRVAIASDNTAFSVNATLQTQTDTIMIGGVNIKEINAVTPLMGNGLTGTGSMRVTLASDGTAISTVGYMSVKLDQTTVGTTNAVSLAQIGATTVATGNGVVGAGVQRVAIASDNTAFSVNSTLQTQTDTIMIGGVNIKEINAVTPLMGNGLTGTGSLRVTLASDTTSNTNPLLFNQSQINGVALSSGNGVSGTGVQRVTIASDNSAVSGVGAAATGAVVPANAVYNGLIASTANPSAASAGNLVGAMADKLGRQVVVLGNVRDLKGNQFTTISASTSETTVVTQVASTFLDVYGCIVENTSATATKVTFKDSTSGTTQFEIYVPGGDTRGFMLPSSDGFKQTTVNTNWTATCGTSVSSVVISMLYVKNI